MCRLRRGVACRSAGFTKRNFVNLVCNLFAVAFVLLFARVVLSWIPIAPGSPLTPVYSFVFAVTEPVLAPIRSALPPLNVGGVGLDLSIFVVFILLELFKNVVHC